MHPTPVYDSARRPVALIEEALALYKYRDLLTQFISRSIKTRYKRSVLGVIWTLLNPLITMIVLTIIFSSLFKFTINYYPVYVLSGLVMWSFFSYTTSSAMNEILWNGNLLSRIYVPKSVFAVSAVGTNLFNLAISLVPLLLIGLVLGLKISLAIFFMPLAIVLLALFSLGIGLLLSTLVAYFSDILPIYEVLLVIWMYATPIIYPIDIVPERLVWLLKLNPLYYIITIFREPLLNNAVPDLTIWLIAAGFAFSSFIIGALIFTSKADEYAYRV